MLFGLFLSNPNLLFLLTAMCNIWKLWKFTWFVLLVCTVEIPIFLPPFSSIHRNSKERKKEKNSFNGKKKKEKGDNQRFPNGIPHFRDFCFLFPFSFFTEREKTVYNLGQNELIKCLKKKQAASQNTTRPISPTWARRKLTQPNNLLSRS